MLHILVFLYFNFANELQSERLMEIALDPLESTQVSFKIKICHIFYKLL